MGRYWRGEKLSAHKFVKIHAAHHLVSLLNRCTESAQQVMVDNLDPTRCFEFIHPALGPELEGILLLQTPEAAQGLVSLLKQELPAVTAEIPSEIVPIIENKIQISGKMTLLKMSDKHLTNTHP